jgi:hypothetical protein
MKTTFFLLALAAGLTVSALAEPLESGPNKGKLVGQAPDLAEAVISPESVLTVTFLDADKKPTPPGPRTVSVFAQLDSGRQPVEMVATGEGFVSATPLPKPDGYLLVVQLRANANAKPSNSRVHFAMHVCGGCQLPEYACTCTDH